MIQVFDSICTELTTRQRRNLLLISRTLCSDLCYITSIITSFITSYLTAPVMPTVLDPVDMIVH